MDKSNQIITYILPSRNKKSDAVGNLHNMTYHALMDHEPDKFSAEAAKSNKRVHACIRRSASFY